MLTKDLIRVRVRQGLAYPQFVRVDDPELLDLAGQLLAVYQLGGRPRRAELEETVTPLLGLAHDRRLAQGLNKLLEDRGEFSHTDEVDYAAVRRQVFAASARLLAAPKSQSAADFAQEVRRTSGVSEELLKPGIYADLPENEQLVAFSDLSPRELLQRYNLALVQSLLLYAGQLEFLLREPEPAKLRRAFRFLKFFRLLARITAEPPDRAQPNVTVLRVVVDGPASIFDNPRKYGLQLASFFPAVCDLASWQLHATLDLGGRAMKLRLDNSCQLVGHYQQAGVYVPEEIRLFHQQFASAETGWKIVAHTPFLKGAGQELVFPDLTFENARRQVLHLELFHRWHHGQLLARLELGAQHPELPLLIGVDRFLAEKPDLKAALDHSPWFASRGLVFRDFPIVKTVVECLERAAAEQTQGRLW